MKINFKDTFWLSLNSGIKIFIGLIGSILLTRILGVEIFGKYQYLLSINSIAAIFVLPGINGALINSAARGSDGDFIVARRRRFKWLPVYFLIFIIIGSIAYLKSHEESIILSFSIAAIGGGILLQLNFYTSFLVGRREYKTFFIYDIFNSLTIILVGCSYLIFHNIKGFNLNVNALICISLGYQIIIHSIITYKIKKRILTSEKSADFEKYVNNVSMMSIIGGLQSGMDNYLVGTFISTNELAQYSIAKKMLDSIKCLWSIMQAYLQPRLVKMGMNLAFKGFFQFLKMYFFLIPALILCAFVIPGAINLFYGTEYTKSILYSQLFLLAILVSFPNYYLETFFRAKQYYSDLYIGRIVNVVSLITLFIFLYYYNVYGLIINRIITLLILCIVMTFLFVKKNTDIVVKD